MKDTMLFHKMLIAMVGDDELLRMVEEQARREHNPSEWGLDLDDDELSDARTEYYYIPEGGN